jgi:hypothetical protein
MNVSPHSLVAKRSNGNAEIQVRFSVGAPLKELSKKSDALFLFKVDYKN